MKISVVTPLYKSAPYIEELHRRSVAAIQLAKASEYEIILVNDGSPDDSLDLAKRVAVRDPSVIVIDLSRNFGQHYALLAGLGRSTGDLVFIMDSDLEEEPEWIAIFLKALQVSGADVAYGVQTAKKHGYFYRFGRRLFYIMLNSLSDLRFPENVVTAQQALMTIQGLTIDHTDRENLSWGFRNVGRASVHWIDCRVVAGSRTGVVPGVNYGAWYLQQSDTGDNDTGPFWNRIVRPRVDGGTTPVPVGIRADGASNALHITGFDCWNVDRGVQFVGTSATNPIPNGVTVTQSNFEACVDAIRYIGASGVNGIAWHNINNNRYESISDSCIQLAGVDIDHPSERGIAAGPDMFGSGLTYINNPEGLTVDDRN